MQKTIIKINKISKSFNGQKVLDQVSLTCESGKIYGIIGYNGSGKTVLFKCICGFYKVDSGEIKVNDNLIGKDIDLLDNAGILIEEAGYLKDFSGFYNLKFLYGIRNKKNDEHIRRIMQKVGLDSRDRKKVKNYSLGMRQRLAIAQAIMEDQSIIILDEPMNGLDKQGVIDMRYFFEELKNEGKLILIASHNKDDIDILCDNVYEMDQGKLVSRA